MSEVEKELYMVFDTRAPRFPYKLFTVTKNHHIFCVDGDKITRFYFMIEVWTKSDYVLPIPLNQITNIFFDDMSQTLILQAQGGLAFFHYNDYANTLQYLGINDMFHFIYGWADPKNQILIGRFYKDKTILGICTKHKERGIAFYGLTNEELKKELDTAAEVEMEYSDEVLTGRDNADIYLTDLTPGATGHVLIRHPKALTVYSFDDDFEIKPKLEIPALAMSASDDVLLFGQVSGTPHRDILHFNQSGLFAYQFIPNLLKFEFVFYHSFFSYANGWTRESQKAIKLYDFNKDGRVNLFFSGPQGLDVISLDKKTNFFISIFNSSSVALTHRYSRVIDASEGHASLLYDDKLQYARMRRSIIYSTTNATEQTNTTATVSEVIPAIKSTLRKDKVLLKNQIDQNFLMNAVDMTTGKVKLVLPLIDSSNSLIELNIRYESAKTTDTSNGVLGSGWILPTSFIYVDYRASNFPEDHTYYLSYDGSVVLLKVDEKENNKFKVPQFDFLEVEYNKNNLEWVVKNNKTKMLMRFGGSNIRWSTKWKDWMGEGSLEAGADNLIMVPTVWYLYEVSHETRGVVLYRYDRVDIMVGRSVSYTREVYLQSIRDSQDKEITFIYSKVNEENNEPVVDVKGILQTPFVNNRFLTGFKYSTPKHDQTVEFRYQTIQERRFLTEIVEEEEKVICFKYEYNNENEFLLVKAGVINGVEMEFQYRNIGEHMSLSSDLEYRQEFDQSYRVDYSDVILLSTLSKYGQVEVKAIDKDVLEEVKLKFPIIGKRGATRFNTVVNEAFYTVLLGYQTGMEICVFGRLEDSWSTSPTCYEMNMKTIVEFGEDFIAFKKPKEKVEVLEWDLKKRKTILSPLKTEVSNDDVLMSVQQRQIVMYDDKALHICYKTDKWTCERIKTEPSYRNKLETFLDEFELNSKAREDALEFLKRNILRFNGNTIALSAPSADSSSIFLRVQLFILNSSHKISRESTVELGRKYITKEACKVCVISQDENDYHLGYKRNKGNFQVAVLKTVKGKKTEPFPTHVVEEYVQKNMKVLLFDLPEYMVTTSVSGFSVGKQKIAYDGCKWVTSDLTNSADEDVVLGDDLMLSKQIDNGMWNIYKQTPDQRLGSKLFSLGVPSLNQTQVRYPNYIAVQGESGGLRVVKLSSGSSIKVTRTFDYSERLSPWTGVNHLVTESGTKGGEYIIIRNVIEWYLHPNSVVKTSLVRFGGETRVIGYEYEDSSQRLAGDTVFYETTKRIPGDNKKLHGWVQLDKSIQTVFDGQGKIVSVMDHEEETQDEKVEEDLANIIFDKSGILVVAKFSPDVVLQKEVSYFGFENYETNRIGVINGTEQRKWQMKEEAITREDFPFTGNSLLKLVGDNDTLTGTFYLNSEDNYIAGSWMRGGEALNLGGTTPLLKVKVFSGDDYSMALGVVKYISASWMYIEVLIDVQGTLTMLTNEVQPTARVKVQVEVRPPPNTTLHVDHVRFHPLTSNFQANSFNHLQLPMDILSPNGLVKRNVYDEYGQKIAMTDEFNKIITFNSYNKHNGRKWELDVRPQTGYIETFDDDAFKTRWLIDKASAWQRSASCVRHTGPTKDKLVPVSAISNKSSYGLRMRYKLLSKDSAISWHEWQVLRKNYKNKILSPGTEAREVSPEGELIFIQDEERVFLWIEGSLHLDRKSVSLIDFAFTLTGMVDICDLIIFEQPGITLTYLNEFKEKVQEIKYEGPSSVLIRQHLYDDIGREGAQTKWVRKVQDGPLLGYSQSWVSNAGQTGEQSFWKTGRLQGDINKWDAEGDGYSFKQTSYANNPMDEVIEKGLPGKEFTINSPYSSKYSTDHEEAFIHTSYPAKNNHTYLVEFKPGDVIHINVFDKNNLKVATYIKVPNRMPILSTYEYNEKKQLVKSLPPSFHEQARTMFKMYEQTTPQQKKIERQLELALGTFISYTDEGSILTKTTPDTGVSHYIYDQDILKYLVYLEKNGKVRETIAFEYDSSQRLISAGRLLTPKTASQLKNLTISFADIETHNWFFYDDWQTEPLLRGRVEKFGTYNLESGPLYEEKLYNGDGRVVRKSVLLPDKEEGNRRVSLNTRYEGEYIAEVEYPSEIQQAPLILTFQRDKLGRFTGITLKGSPEPLVEYSYTPEGLVASEIYLSNSSHSFTRQFSYNAPGFLTEIDDPYLREGLSYTEQSYGGLGYGDGTITRTQYTAKWHNKTKLHSVSLNEASFASDLTSNHVSKLCFQSLKHNGYINENNHQQKLFYPKDSLNIPIICSLGAPGRHIQQVLGREGFPEEYGHVYDYGNHQELIKAKYFVGTAVPEPLQPTIFFKAIPNWNSTKSIELWQDLTRSGFIIENTGKEMNDVQGKMRRSLVRKTLSDDLKSVDADYVGYVGAIETFLTKSLTDGRSLSSKDLQEAFVKWNPLFNKNSQALWEMLTSRMYLSDPLETDLKNILYKYPGDAAKILKVLLDSFKEVLGEAEFDVESYDIDINGNHRKFYSNGDRYVLHYKDNTNQIDWISLLSNHRVHTETKFAVKHDHRGNIIQALHKGIERIDYDYVINRPSKVTMCSGQSVTYNYDSRGERVLKTVKNSTGKILETTDYFRDEKGRCLVERKVKFVADEQAPDMEVTSYVYGPRGLVGFFRRNQFYVVVTDHAGSIRLVLKSGEVVAVYDYMPYGGLMRKFVSYPGADIMYRYTGHEWDEVLQLYNFHERLYDPDIGRFYQVDPLEQYFSPYKYAGNSPISMIDPDGQFAIMLAIAIGLAIGGAYLGGAAANNNWNLLQWKYDRPGTWGGIILGGIVGFAAPYGAVASVGALSTVMSTGAAVATTAGTATVLTYFNVAAENNNWKFWEWDYKSPGTWNSAFVGVTTGVSVIGGFSQARSAFLALSKVGKYAYGAGAVITGGGFFVLGGISNDWDFTKPGIYNSFLQSVMVAADMPQLFQKSYKYVVKNGRIVSNNVGKMNTRILLAWREGRYANPMRIFPDIAKMQEFRLWTKTSGKAILQLGGIAGSSYLIGSMSMDSWNWDMKKAESWNGLLNSIFTGTAIHGSGKAFLVKLHKGRIKETLKARKTESQEAALQANKEYQKWIDEGTIVTVDKDNKPIYGKGALDKLKDKQIPNTVISVGILKNKYLLVGYSGNTAPGMLFVFKRGKLESPIVKIPLDINNKVADRPLVLHMDETQDIFIRNAIQEARDPINRKLFDTAMEGAKPEFLKILKSIDEASSISVLKEIENSLGAIDMTEKKRFREIILNSILENHPKAKSLRYDIDNLTNELQELKSSGQNPQKKAIELGKVKGELRKFEKLVGVESTKMTSAFEKYLDNGDLAVLDPTNCAEAKVVSMAARFHDVINSPITRNNYVTSDIQYLSAFSTDGLGDKPRCANCVHTTASVRNIMTDLDWLTAAENSLNKARENLKQKYYFPTLRTYPWQYSNKTNMTRTKREASYQTFGFLDRVSSALGNLISWKSEPSPSDADITLNGADTNGTLLLLDVLVRKLTGQKYVGRDTGRSSKDALLEAMTITDRFEEVLQEQIEDPSEFLDFTKVQSDIYKSLITDRAYEIPKIIFSYIDTLSDCIDNTSVIVSSIPHVIGADLHHDCDDHWNYGQYFEQDSKQVVLPTLINNLLLH